MAVNDLNYRLHLTHLNIGEKNRLPGFYSIFRQSFPLCIQAPMRTLLRSARPYHRLPRKREKRRERKGSWRSRRCWFSIWKTQRHLPCKWNEQSLSSTPCCTGKPLQVEDLIHWLISQLADWFLFDVPHNSTSEIFNRSGPRGCAVLCHSMRVQRCQLCQWSSEDAAFGLVNWCCH